MAETNVVAHGASRATCQNVCDVCMYVCVFVYLPACLSVYIYIHVLLLFFFVNHVLVSYCVNFTQVIGMAGPHLWSCSMKSCQLTDCQCLVQVFRNVRITSLIPRKTFVPGGATLPMFGTVVIRHLLLMILATLTTRTTPAIAVAAMAVVINAARVRMIAIPTPYA